MRVSSSISARSPGVCGYSSLLRGDILIHEAGLRLAGLRYLVPQRGAHYGSAAPQSAACAASASKACTNRIACQARCWRRRGKYQAASTMRSRPKQKQTHAPACHAHGSTG